MGEDGGISSNNEKINAPNRELAVVNLSPTGDESVSDSSGAVKQISGTNPPNTAEQQSSGWTTYLLFCNAIVILGTSFMYGYCTGAVNTPFAVMKAYVNETYHAQNDPLTPEQLSAKWALFVSLHMIGGIVGSIWFPAALSRRVGRRKALQLNSFIGVLGSLIMFISPWTDSSVPLMLGRPIVGFQVGFGMSLAPGLVAEHAPARLRGACGTIFANGIALGLVFGNFLGFSFILGKEHTWHYIFLVAAGICALHGIGLFFVVEGPRYLIDKNREEAAIHALKKLRNASSEEAVQNDFQTLKKQVQIDSTVKPISLVNFFKDRNLWWPMIIVIQLHCTSQLTGLGATLFYSTQVLNNAGLDPTLSGLATFALSFIILIVLAVGSFIIDPIGRRPLMLAGAGGMCISNVMLVIVLTYKSFQASIAGFALFLFSFSLGPGSVSWVMPAELFNQQARPTALQVAMLTSWGGNLIVSYVFPIMRLSIGQYSFVPFAVIAFLEFIFMLLFLPETSSHHVTMEAMANRFSAGKALVHVRAPNRTESQVSVLTVQI